MARLFGFVSVQPTTGNSSRSTRWPGFVASELHSVFLHVLSQEMLTLKSEKGLER